MHLGRRPPLLNPLLALLTLLLLPSPLFCAAGDDSLRKSLVKIFTTVQNPNYYEPWKVDAQFSVSGSGCVLPGHRILTNAHVVSNQIFIEVLKEGDAKKYIAHKEFVAHDCDLAVLTVDDPKFFQGTQPVKFGDLPYLRDKVAVYGFPVGGEELSITEGVVSRIEVVPYAHSMRSLLGVQTDAAINPGNSGGPAFQNGKLVGVAFQGYNALVAQNTGYLIPIPIVKRFLAEIKGGAYKGIPSLGIFYETLENDTLREYLGLKPDQTGVLVTKTVWRSSAWDLLRENDVLLSTGGYPIGNDGTIPFRRGERLNLSYPLNLRRIGDKMTFKVLRNGKVLSVILTLREERRLVPLVQYDRNPTYFIFDGILFTPFNTNYPGISNNTPSELRTLYYDGLPTENRKEVVLVNHIISHEINQGCDASYANLIVTKVNGRPISEMKDLIPAFEHPLDGRHVIEFDKPKEVGTKIVLDAAKSKKASAEILDLCGIPSDRSPDLADPAKAGSPPSPQVPGKNDASKRVSK